MKDAAGVLKLVDTAYNRSITLEVGGSGEVAGEAARLSRMKLRIQNLAFHFFVVDVPPQNAICRLVSQLRAFRPNTSDFGSTNV